MAHSGLHHSGSQHTVAHITLWPTAHCDPQHTVAYSTQWLTANSGLQHTVAYSTLRSTAHCGPQDTVAYSTQWPTAHGGPQHTVAHRTSNAHCLRCPPLVSPLPSGCDCDCGPPSGRGWGLASCSPPSLEEGRRWVVGGGGRWGLMF